MKKLYFIIVLFCGNYLFIYGQVGIGTSRPDSSSILDINSTTKGVLLPRLTTEERDQIQSGNAVEGLIIYNKESKTLEIFDGKDWNKFLLKKIISSTDMLNESFENWKASLPENWITIDTGIEVEKESVIVDSGTSSAKITLKTKLQDQADFRRNITLEKGVYEVSFKIYHSDNASRVRLFVNGFQNYSDSTIQNQWQDVHAEYEMIETETIEVGFRFYDLDSFDNESISYIDDLTIIKKQ